MHIVSTGSLVVLGPFGISPLQETQWYALYATVSVWLWWLLFLTQNKIYMVINNKNGSCLFMVYLISSFIGISAYGQDYTLMILVKNVRNDKGVLRVTLFSRKEINMENFSTNN